jgi:membrane fusion protein (multidrug efflux system)
MRALEVDGYRHAVGGVLLSIAVLGGWVAWGCLARVVVYEVTPQARLEVDRAVHPIATPLAGRVAATHLMVDQEVQAGEILVELDVEPQRLQQEEARVRLAALANQLAARRQEHVAEEAARQGEEQAARLALDEARARHHEAAVAAQAAAAEAEVYTRLQARGLAAQLDFMRSHAEAHKRLTAANTLRLAINRLDGEQQTRARDRMARLVRLQREVVQIEGELATATATLGRLGHEIEQRHIKAPVTGRLGEVANLQPGTVVQAGDTLGMILPPGTLQVVAYFPPAVALGRLAPHQPARLRLTGFPWTQYGSLAATVARVAHEARDGQIRVELSLLPDPPSAIPLQHGLPGTVEVAVEQVAPVTLVLRAVGKRLGIHRHPVDAAARRQATR